jgi:hypothetical protein
VLQFALLDALGLRETHRLLDLGCGSLRAGRMLIPYLAAERYIGVDPNGWLIDAAIEKQLGADVLAVKRPRFDHTQDFSLDSVRGALGPAGIAAVTPIHPGTGDLDAVEIDLHDSCASEAIEAAGLVGQPIGWYHPRHQWWLLAGTHEDLPPEPFLATRRGPTLAAGFEASWSPGQPKVSSPDV